MRELYMKNGEVNIVLFDLKALKESSRSLTYTTFVIYISFFSHCFVPPFFRVLYWSTVLHLNEV